MASSRPSVAIIGGGIGGLFAANALIAHGLQTVQVFEQAPALGEVGAGVFITPNSVRQLERVGLGPAVEKWGARVGSHSCYFRDDGSPIAPVQVTDSQGWNATFGMHRADMVGLLAAALPPDVVHTGYRAIGFAQDDKAAIPFLSKIPIIGNIFKSKAERSERTELMVLITPRLVRALDPDEVPPLPVDQKRFLPRGEGIGEHMAGGLDALREQRTGAVVLEVAAVGDGEDGEADRDEGAFVHPSAIGLLRPKVKTRRSG